MRQQQALVCLWWGLLSLGVTLNAVTAFAPKNQYTHSRTSTSSRLSGGVGNGRGTFGVLPDRQQRHSFHHRRRFGTMANVAVSSTSTAASTTTTTTTSTTTTVPDYNAVEVAKTGGQGVKSASEKAVEQNLSLGAPRGRPDGGTFLTKGGVQVKADVHGLEFSKSIGDGNTSEAAIEHLIERLDSHRGVLLTSSYEFPGRYARWSLGFIDPPLEVSGKGSHCKIRALNPRGKVLLPAIQKAMEQLKEEGTLSDVDVVQEDSSMVEIDVTVVPLPEVGSFSEEERSRQVSTSIFLCVYV